MQFPDSFFEDEVRDGFYIPALMKRAWAAKLEVLTDIAEVCEKNHLQWFADFGTLLGAVRHKGFIPWDDDIDICMLRDDLVHFKQIAEKELPEGYYVPLDLPEDYRLIQPVFNGNSIRLEKKHLEKYHGFPFPTAIDIFPLDYVAPDPQDEEFRKNITRIVNYAATLTNEENQNTEEIQRMAAQIEEMLRIRLDRDKPLRDQLLALRDNLFALYTGDEGVTEVADMYHWVNDDPYIYPLEAFRNPVMLPFEIIEVPAPSVYEQVLKVEFGDYMKYCRAGDGHAYPFYEPQKRVAIELLGEDRLPFMFRFSKYPPRKPRIGIESKSGGVRENFVQLAEKAHQGIRNAIDNNNYSTARELLGVCQNSAIQFGTMLEQSEGECAAAVVGLLENYCELTWQLYESLPGDSVPNADEIHNRLEKLLEEIENRVQNDIRSKKEIVFLPFKASLWDSLKPYWQEVQADPNYKSSVIPIPYFYKSFNGSLREMVYEGDRFPVEVPITDYRLYDFKSHHPYMIFIQNPYDECNLTTSVHPLFYSGNLMQYTDQLIYVPWFHLDETDLKEPKAVKNMEHYAAMPGVVHADQVIVQSEAMRLAYIDFLAQAAGENTRTIWEEKITCSSPIPFLKMR